MTAEIEQALGKLEWVKSHNGYYTAKCPCHDDRVASLSIREADGKLLIYCHAGCEFKDIINALDLSPTKTVQRVEVAHYDYTDAESNLVYQVVRYEPKNFRQRRPDGNDWIWDLRGITPVLYNLPAVMDAVNRGAYVVWCEGEKDCNNLSEIGITATTTSGGSSGKWKAEYTQSLIGAKVAIIPDNDEPGKTYAKRIADSLYGYAEVVKVVELEVDLKCDVSDWLTLGNDKKKLANLIKNAPEYTPPQAISREEFESLRMMVSYLNKKVKTRQPTTKRNYKYSSIKESE